MTWYVARTKPQAETRAVRELRRLGLRVYLPKRLFEVRHRLRHREASIHRRALLCGYVLIRFPAQMLDRRGREPFGRLAECTSVHELLRWSDGRGERSPVPLADKLVGALMHRQRMREFDDSATSESRRIARRARFMAEMHKGRTMLVIDGPFAGREVTIDVVNDSDTVTALLSIFGRPTPMRFDNPQDQIKALSEST